MCWSSSRPIPCFLIFWMDVSVPNQSYVFDILNTHNSHQPATDAIAVKSNALRDFRFQLGERHVWFVPAIFGNYAFISGGGLIDDLEYCGQVRWLTRQNGFHFG